MTFTVDTGRVWLERPREGKVKSGYLGHIFRMLCPLTLFRVVHWVPENQEVRVCSPSVSPGPGVWFVGLRQVWAEVLHC